MDLPEQPVPTLRPKLEAQDDNENAASEKNVAQENETAKDAETSDQDICHEAEPVNVKMEIDIQPTHAEPIAASDNLSEVEVGDKVTTEEHPPSATVNEEAAARADTDVLTDDFWQDLLQDDKDVKIEPEPSSNEPALAETTRVADNFFDELLDDGGMQNADEPAETKYADTLNNLASLEEGEIPESQKENDVQNRQKRLHDSSDNNATQKRQKVAQNSDEAAQTATTSTRQLRIRVATEKLFKEPQQTVSCESVKTEVETSNKEPEF